jgi:hypothetical protein
MNDIHKQESFEGSCTCRFVRYRMDATPIFIHCCHCTWCQRETGASFALNAMIEASRVTLLDGDPEIVDIPTLSGAGQRVARCPRCKVALWSNYSGSGDLIRFVRVGTLEEPGRFPPDVHIFTESKQPWVTLSDSAPEFKQYYSRKQLWPQETLERLAAAKVPKTQLE